MRGTTVRKKRPTRREQYEAKRKKRYERWRESHPGPHPYVEWEDHAEGMRDRVRRVLGPEGEPCLKRYSKGGGDTRPLHVEDLAIALWAVECVGKRGLSYGQLAYCFKVCSGGGCSNAKASAVLSELRRLGIIVKVGNYSQGRRGNQYAIVPEPVEFMGIIYHPPKPVEIQPKQRTKATVPEAILDGVNDDPFG